jgi:putative hydrolase of HD superfamily
MCLLHDLPESRISDLNYVNKKYVAVNEKKVIEEIQSDYPCVPEIKALLDEYNEGSSIESQLAHDADQLELLLFLKRESELGNPKAMDWFDKSEQRLQTDEAKELAKEIRSTASDSWWLVNPDDPHWIKPSPNLWETPENLSNAFNLLANLPDDFFSKGRQDLPPQERENF